jgi:copper chaperone
MSEHTYKFNVSMSCGGCSGAVNRVLAKLDGASSSLLPPFSPLRQTQKNTQLTHPLETGVKSFDVSLDTQTATVIADTNLPYETVLQTIKKTGKAVNSGEADGVERPIDL